MWIVVIIVRLPFLNKELLSILTFNYIEHIVVSICMAHDETWIFGYLISFAIERQW